MIKRNPRVTYKNSISSSYARITLILSRNPFLWAILQDRFSAYHPISAQSWSIEVFTGLPTLVCPCVGVHQRMSLKSSFLLNHQNVLFILDSLRDKSGLIAVVLWNAAPSICSEKNVASLCSFHLAFSQIFRWSPCGASIQKYWNGYNLEEFAFYLIRE